MSYLFTDAEIHEAIGGILTEKNWSVKGVSIDSRTSQKVSYSLQFKPKEMDMIF